jgi:anti-sigma factor RsiW
VRHGRARRLLAALPDETLPRRTEREVRAHALRCGACRRHLARLEASAELLRLLPRSLVPERPSPAAEARLAALARWSRPPEPSPWRGALGIPAFGALAAAATLAIVLSLGSWAPVADEPRQPVLYAARYAGPAPTLYSWR